MGGAVKFLIVVACISACALCLSPSVDGQKRAETDSAESTNSKRPLTELEKIHHLLSRFTLGPSEELIKHVHKVGAEKWLDEQLLGIAEESDQLHSKLADLPSYFMTNQEIMKEYIMILPPNPTIEQLREANRLREIPRAQLKEAVLLNAVHSKNQVLETSCDFFRNHFAIELRKGACRYFGPEYEREVIRENALGSFGSMLHQNAKHPAMLHFLDNYLSRRPPSEDELKKIEAREKARDRSNQQIQETLDIAKQRGLNENYARELFELHTLGVKNEGRPGGYSQKDIVELARCLTGWTYSGNRDTPVVFTFRDSMHDKGRKVIMGKGFEDKKDGVKEGEAVIDMLLEHKETSYFLSEKLCRYYVNDDPSSAMIMRVSMAWRKSNGDIPTVLKAIAMDKDFYDRENFQTKYKRPFEFVVSALRATNADVTSTRRLMYYLLRMKEELYECPDPTGYYDQAEAWNDPGAIATRWKFCADLASERVPGIRFPDSLFEALNPRLPATWKDELVKKVWPVGLSKDTDRRLNMLVERYLEKRSQPTPRELGSIIVAGILGSPDFQRQ